MVPEGWILTAIEEHVDLLSGFAFKSGGYSEDTTDVKLLRGDNIEPGRIRWKNAKRWPSSECKDLTRYQLNEGDFVIAMDRTYIFSGLKVAEVTARDTPSLLVQRVARIRARDTLDQRLLRQYFSSYRFEQYVKSVQTETAVPHISARQIKEFPLALPPMEEQSRIADILARWDQAIETTEKLIENSKAQKKALMQQLLTGKKRLPEFCDEWRQVQFTQVFERITSKNDEGIDNVLTISGRHGLVNQRDFFNKRVASNNLDNYTVLRRGDFAYNKSYSAGYPYGAVKPLERYDTGVVSNLYLCFRLTDSNKYCRNYFRHYFEGGFFDREIYKIAQEGARNHGLLNVGSTDFFSTHFTRTFT